MLPCSGVNAALPPRVRYGLRYFLSLGCAMGFAVALIVGPRWYQRVSVLRALWATGCGCLLFLAVALTWCALCARACIVCVCVCLCVF